MLTVAGSPAVDVQALHQFVAAVPGTFGQSLSRRLAVDWIAAGRTDAAAALVGIIGPEVVPALVAAGAPAPILRTAIQHAVLFHSARLPGSIAQHGGRAAFAEWCRLARFELPRGVPETVDVYRGTMGCSPAEAVQGMHWSLKFDHAAFYGARHADADLTGVIVVHARIPRAGIALHVSNTHHSEVVPAEAPRHFEVIADHQGIGDAAVRYAIERREVVAAGDGWSAVDSFGGPQRAAAAARARMAAAGVPRGTAIVA